MSLLSDWRLSQLEKYCPTNNNWILFMNFKECINHSNRRVRCIEKGQLVETSLEEGVTLDHIYFNYMTGERLTALVAVKIGGEGRLILIDNIGEVEMPPEQDDEVEIKLSTCHEFPKIKGVESTLTIIKSIGDLVNREVIPKKYQKTIGLYQWFNKWSTDEGGKRNESLPLKLLGTKDETERLRCIDNWIRHSGFKLDFSHNYSISDEELSKLGKYSEVKHIVFDQNCQLTSFEFLRNFREVKIIEFYQCQQITNQIFKSICYNIPDIEAIILKNNISIDVRAILPVLQLSRIRLLKIDYPNFLCQRDSRQGLISKEEWKSCHSFTLEELSINSESLSIDVLDYILKACPKLRTVALSEISLKDFAKNASFDETNHLEEAAINFHLMSDLRKGIRASKPIYFRNMYKDLISEPFSKSMLSKMRQSE